MEKYAIQHRKFSSKVHHTIVLSFLFSLFSFVTFAQVSSSIDSTSIKIGAEAKFTVEVTADSTDLVIFPEGQTFLPLEVIESYKVDTTYEESKYRLIKKYGLTQFDSGRYTIPKQKIYINEKIFETDSFSLEVRDVIVDTTKQKMFDIKPAIEVDSPPFDYIQLLYWLVPLLLLAVLVGYLLFRRKKIKEAREEKLPPYEEAITALHQLDNSELLKHHKSKEYYSQLTDIVKRYLDREVDDTVLEKTTDELIERLQLLKDGGSFDFDAENIRELQQILRRADLVKFAKMQQEEGQARADRNTIEEIINETHEAVPEPTEEELLQNELYLEELRKKKQRNKWILGAIGLVSVVLISALVYGSVTGFDNLKDQVFGNEMRDLSEGKWIKSEYGNPAVIIETPEVLVRVPIAETGNESMLIKDKSVFVFGQLSDPLYINVSSTSLQQEKPVDLDKALDESLVQFEQSGATNLLVKREDFETESGIKGLKAFGKFNVKVNDNEVLKNDSYYELILFSQEAGLQQVIVVYQEDGRFAEAIKNRIIRSVEIEVQQTQGTEK
ncbi:DUF4381 family protein [Jejudonia soesokkakensis]|uniref:DUF4381 family protein n=1 Tax=Jejudonia soesokkakensis TaxID=1323432 RepID=A0ABW2MPK6_9FLAO